MLTNDLFLEPNIAWNDPSVCVSCKRVNTGRPEGQGGTYSHISPSPLEVARLVEQLLAVIAIGIGLSHRLAQAPFKRSNTSQTQTSSVQRRQSGDV